jgi:glutamate--cysteine ligase
VPALLENIHEQFLIPPPCTPAGMCAASREHFAAYQDVAIAFAKEIGIDPWLINSEFETCGKVNFHERQARNAWPPTSTRCSTACAPSTRNTASTRRALRHRQGRCRHLRHGHHDGERRRRGDRPEPQAAQQDGVVKEGLEVSEVLIQEGVHTFETLNDAVAEPVVYMIDRYVVGGFYRVHTGRGKDENLNAPGMHFEPLAFETGCNLPDYQLAVTRRAAQPLLCLRRGGAPGHGWPRRAGDRTRLRRRSRQ